jgi:hypothetical protein
MIFLTASMGHYHESILRPQPQDPYQ